MSADCPPSVVRHRDARAFHAAAQPVLNRNVVEGVALEVAIGGFIRNPPQPGAEPYLATVANSECAGAIYLYGGEIAALGASDALAASWLAADLAGANPALSGAIGMAEPCAAFLEEWNRRLGTTHRLAMHFRQHLLHELLPVPVPAGFARRATPEDLQWMMAVQIAAAAESGMVRPRTNWESMTLRAIEAGRYWVWDNDGPVSYVGWAPALRPAARIAPVGTPPEQRSRGYATALTAALVRSLVEEGRRQIVLTTDIDAPVPNAIYARLGFRPTTESFRYEIMAPEVG
ncbi:MAG: GNAT family N-acetyltransferase [Burkholderiales bacterium]